MHVGASTHPGCSSLNVQLVNADTSLLSITSFAPLPVAALLVVLLAMLSVVCLV